VYNHYIMLMNSNNHAAKENERAARKAALEQAIKDEGWTRRKEMVKGGVYVESNVERTVTVSADGRFKIYPCGTMRRVRDHGVHGDLYNGWRWTGYTLSDAEQDTSLGSAINRAAHTRSVRRIKEAVARWRLGR
jgi:hypothetical protein